MPFAESATSKQETGPQNQLETQILGSRGSGSLHRDARFDNWGHNLMMQARIALGPVQKEMQEGQMVKETVRALVVGTLAWGQCTLVVVDLKCKKAGAP